MRTVSWVTCYPLNCGNSLPADVIICVKPELIALPLTTFVPTTIEGSLISASRCSENLCGCSCGGNSCSGNCGCNCGCNQRRRCGYPSGPSRYTYILAYDEAQLIDGVILKSSDITGVICRGCLTSYIDNTAMGMLGSYSVDFFQSDAGNILTMALGESIDYDVVLTNPYSQNMVVMIFCKWKLGAASLAAFNAQGIIGNFLVDGVLVPGIGNQGLLISSPWELAATFVNVQLSQIQADFTHLTLAPNETKTFTLRITRDPGSVDPPPTTSLELGMLHIYAQGFVTL